jgi:hypothetical protein
MEPNNGVALKARDNNVVTCGYFYVLQSLCSLLTHLIFSTKNREPLLAGKDLQHSLHPEPRRTPPDRHV